MSVGVVCLETSRSAGAQKVGKRKVNKNYSARMHVDKGNKGLSRLIALRRFHSGELWVDRHDPSGAPRPECQTV